MADDVLSSLVHVLAGLGHDIGEQLADPDSRQALMARAGVVPPSGAPPAAGGALDGLDGLRTGGAGGQGGDSLQQLEQLGVAMADLVAFVQEACDVQNADDAWNLLATFIDLVALDLMRLHRPEIVAIGQAMHLISDDRILLADLIRAGDHWGSFVLGNPVDDDSKADNWSLILGALLVGLGVLVPVDDAAGEGWRVDVLFGWDAGPNPEFPHAARVLERMATVRLTRRDTVTSSGVEAEEHAGISAVVVPPSDGGWGVFFALDLGAGLTIPIRTTLELALEADSPDAIEAFIGHDGFIQTGLQNTTAKLHLRRKQSVEDNWKIGPDDGVHLEIARFDVGIDFAETSRLHLLIGDGALVVPKESFGFMGSVLPSGGVKFTFDADLQIDSTGKLTFQGGAGLSVVLPVNLSVSVLRVRSISLAFTLGAGDKGVEAALATVVAFGLDFGPAFKLSVDGIGAKLAWALPSSPSDDTGPVTHGNLGTAGDLSLDFVPPRGIGIVIDTGPVKGGGFFYFDPPHRTYAGVLEAALKLCGMGISVKAAGLLRETDEGWDFVLILSAQFNPAIEIFSGFNLVGVGGMVGINVSVDVDKLRAGLHDGAIGRLLFPDDPVANAPAIIATMISIFPHRQGGIVAGPMLQLGFGRPTPYVTLSVAVVVTSPQPTALMIMGRLRIATPTQDAAIVDIKIDFLGIVDFDEPSFSFDGSIVDSRLAAFTLTGDMAVRAGAPGFILSVGGFHPRFTPPANVPALRRLAIDISANPITKIRAEAYLAVTSNTFQVGLHASLDIGAGGAVSVHGWLDFDALIQWEPKFHFSIHMDIGLELRVGGDSIASVSVDLLLEGPGPWHAKGSASLHLLFFTISAGFEVTWGEIDGAPQPPAVDAFARVSEALSADGACTAVAPDGDAWISFRTVDRAQVPVHPYGKVSVRQQAVPLGIPITRIGLSHVVGDVATVTIAPAAGAPASSPSTGTFAMAQFTDLSDADKLSRPSFESYPDGVVFGSDTMTHPAPVPTTASYETVFIPDGGAKTRSTLVGVLLEHGMLFSSVARSGLHYATLNDGPSQRVTLADPAYAVVNAGTLTESGPAEHAYSSSAAAFAAADTLGAGLLVVGAHEVVG